MAEALLAGQVAVVTGSGQGIGLEIGRVLTEHGAKVVFADIDGAAAKTAAARYESVGYACDVTSEDDVERLVAATTGEFGRLDLFVNNAGITRDASLKKMTVADFDAVVTVHLRGTWLGVRYASAIMREQKSGSIVNISSLSGKVGMVGQTNYSAAKAGIVGLTKAAAKEIAHHGVRVNAIQPGLIRSAMTEAMPQKAWDQKMSEIPMGRAGEPSEVATVALFLASDLSSYMTGTVMEVTGGRFM